MAPRSSVQSTPEAFLKALPEPRRTVLRTLHDAIRAAAPELEPHVLSGILGYGKYHYKYESGREGDWFVVGLSNRQNYISAYVCASEGEAYLAEQNKNRLGKVSVGRSCIRFKKLEDLNLKVFIELVKKASKLTQRQGGFAM